MNINRLSALFAMGMVCSNGYAQGNENADRHVRETARIAGCAADLVGKPLVRSAYYHGFLHADTRNDKRAYDYDVVVGVVYDAEQQSVSMASGFNTGQGLKDEQSLTFAFIKLQGIEITELYFSPAQVDYSVVSGKQTQMVGEFKSCLERTP